MNIIKRFKLRKLNKERERLLNEFTVEDITVQGVRRLGKAGCKDQSNHRGIRT